jgi:hypothetical protein
LTSFGIRLGRGDGTFAEPGLSAGDAMSDVNGDGRVDIAWTDPASDKVFVRFNVCR